MGRPRTSGRRPKRRPSEGLGRPERTSKRPCRASQGKMDVRRDVRKQTLSVLQDIVPFASVTLASRISIRGFVRPSVGPSGRLG